MAVENIEFIILHYYAILLFMKLLYGTTNQAKLKSMKRVTKILGLEIFGLNELKEMPEFANVVLNCAI